MSNTVVFDIESTGLDYKDPDFKVHCICGYNCLTRTEFSFSGCQLLNGLDYISQTDKLVGHNIIGYDIPALNHYFGVRIRKPKLVDTLVLSRLIFPLREEHNLKSWGIDFKLYKGNCEDFSTLTTAMLEYCQQDVRITLALYDKLDVQHYSEKAIELELAVAKIIQTQIDNGVGFDEDAAKNLEIYCEKHKAKITNELQQLFPKFRLTTGGKNPKEKEVEFNPGSKDHIANRLINVFNWKPNKRTPTGKPCVNEEVIESLPYPEVKPLKEYTGLVKLIGMISTGKQAWLSASKNNRVHASVNTNGAITGRMTHFNPNLAQVPRNHSIVGNLCRELFIASPGKVLVGCDASGLEARCIAHYVADYDNGEMAKKISTGDIHNYTSYLLYGRENFTEEERDIAKALFFLVAYMGSANKAAGLTGLSIGEASELRQRLKEIYPAMDKYNKALNEAVMKRQVPIEPIYLTKNKLKSIIARSWINGIDGRKIPINIIKEYYEGREWIHPEAAMNYKVQHTGAIVCKQALIFAAQSFEILGNTDFVLNIHDEIVVETLIDQADDVGIILQESMRLAGQEFNLKCPIDGKYKIGYNWAQLK